MAARFLLFILALLLASPAAAHGLRVFARIEGAEVRGYGFFIGGGRPAGVDWRAELAGQGVAQEVAQGKTDAGGGFAFALPAGAGDLVIVLDTGDGHMASTRLRAGHSGAAAAPAADPQPGPAPDTPAPDTAANTAALEAALSRQLEPLHERLTALEARLRLTDALSALFLIFGLAGMALWALGRRRGTQ